MTTPLLILLAVAAAQFLLVLRAFAVERREGLPPSTARLVIAAVILAIMALAVWRPFRLPERSPKAALEQRIAANEQELRDLRKELDSIRQSTTSPGPVTAAPRPALSPTMLAILIVVFAFGTLAILLSGDPSTLLPSSIRERFGDVTTRRQRARAAAALQRLAAAADDGRYDDGASIAESIDDHLLDRVDVTNYVFLSAYCAVMRAGATTNAGKRAELLQKPIAGLTALIGRAPAFAAGRYLLGVAHGLLDEHKAALEHFDASAKPLAKAELPFTHNRSVCVLGLAAEKLAQNEVPAAEELFRQVRSLEVLGDRVQIMLLEHRVAGIRRSLAAGRLAEARTAVEELRGMKGLPRNDAAALANACRAFDVLVAYREGDDDRTLALVREFVASILPRNLPPVDDETADEYLEAAVDAKSLPFSRETFRGFLFLQAIVAARVSARGGKPLQPEQTQELAGGLLRALQFEPRHREVLAALGILYYWFSDDKRTKAMAWVQSAVIMGTRSMIARRVLAKYRATETERQDLLDRFLRSSGRFFTDPAVRPQVRKALSEELGRFREFQPLLADVDAAGDLPSQDPSIESLRDRAAFLDSLVDDAMRLAEPDRRQLLLPIREEYSRLVNTLGATAARLGELDQSILREVGKIAFGAAARSTT